MMTEKVIKVVVSALIKEFCVNSVEELAILLVQKGIHIGIQTVSDLYYNYQWNNRKQIEYKPLDNPNIKVVPAKDVKLNHNNTYC